jgi:outer membrane protein assembly factor BamB
MNLCVVTIPVRVLLILFTVLFVQLDGAYAADWPNWRGSDYNGISNETDWDPAKLKQGVEPLWRASIGTGFSSVIVSGGKAFAMGNTAKSKDDAEQLDIVFCFDAVTGKELWNHSYENQLDPKNYEGGTLASPTVSGKNVYTVSKDGKAFCLNVDTGNVVWQKNVLDDFGIKRTTWGTAGSPLIMDDMVIYNVGTQGLALNKNDGGLIWKSGTGPGGYATAMPFTRDGKKCIAMFGEKDVKGIVAANGEKIWQYKWETKYEVNAADPVIEGDKVFVSSGYNRGCALLQVNGAEVTKLWENKNMRSHMNGPVLLDGFLYGTDEDQLCCLDFATGQVKWTEKSVGKCSVSAADGKLLVIGDKGKLIIAQASPEGFNVISQAQVLTGKCWTVPVLANGLIYVRNAAGDLVCIDVRGKKNGPVNEISAKHTWHQWRGPNRDGKSPETGLMKNWPQGGPKMLWSLEGLGDGFSSMSISDGLIFTAGKFEDDGKVFAIDLQGNKKWEKLYGREWTKTQPGVRGTPTVDADRVYFISGVGVVYCFDAKTGNIKWQVDAFNEYDGRYARWGIAESALIDGDKIFFTVGGKKAAMVALDKMSGKTIWASKSIDDKAAYCSPILIERAGKRTVVNMMASNIIGVDADTGQLLWQYDIEDYIDDNRQIHASTPAYDDGCLFFSSGYDMGGVKLKIADDGKSVSKLWSTKTMDTHHGCFVLADGYIYGSNWKENPHGDWVCLDWKTGEVMYETKWNGRKGSIIYADGMLYCYDETDGIVGLVKAAPEKFELVSSFKVELGEDQHWAHPVVYGGLLYIRHGQALMAYDIKAP